ncbi:hypothetical protein [Francisella philomiragia]|uniref:hypothetical protein n=1 Tax=Francisella philomiragia TaxID=28110 RepID=UPI0035148F48
MKIIKITSQNNHIYENLVQLYECEFAPLTGEKPDSNGLYVIQTPIKGGVVGYLVYIDNLPVGFMVIKELEECLDVAEFFILPSYRRNRIGIDFAKDIFLRNKGNWQIRQIQGADYATRFWRRVVKELVCLDFIESFEYDSEWGYVTIQRFAI